MYEGKLLEGVPSRIHEYRKGDEITVYIGEGWDEDFDKEYECLKPDKDLLKKHMKEGLVWSEVIKEYLDDILSVDESMEALEEIIQMLDDGETVRIIHRIPAIPHILIAMLYSMEKISDTWL